MQHGVCNAGSNFPQGPIQIDLISIEPIRLAGLVSIFDPPAGEDHPQLIPVTRDLEDLLKNPTLHDMVIDLSRSSNGLETLNEIRRARPEIRQIVIGPQANEGLIQDSIIAGARAYLDHTASPQLVRTPIEEVTAGFIWAPRRVLSRLIDRLLRGPDASLPSHPHLTHRERQVLDLILLARSNREIARHLGIKERTIKAHVGRLMRKTGAENRIELSMRTLNAARGAAEAERRRGDHRQAKRRQADGCTPFTGA